MSDEVHHGLEGIAVAETRLSRIDGEAGQLTMGGFPVEELAGEATYEETLYLLWHDRLPDAEELAAFERELHERRALADETVDLLRAAARREVPPMDALRMGLAAAALARPDDDEGPMADAKLAVAQTPSVVAAYWRLYDGAEPVAPREDLGHAANFLYMLTGAEPADDEVRALETYLNTVIDHGLNASTFAARVVVSTESDVLSAVTAAVGTLAGPLHGGAPGPVLEMLLDVCEADDPGPEGYLRERLEAGERIMGFGHRVYEVRDPRAAVLSDAAEAFYGDEGAFFECAREVERAAVELLDEHVPDRGLETNVEFYTALLLYGIGIPRELFSTLFAVSRVGGWTAHCLEQLSDNRLIRPRARYVGDAGRSWVPLAER